MFTYLENKTQITDNSLELLKILALFSTCPYLLELLKRLSGLIVYVGVVVAIHGVDVAANMVLVSYHHPKWHAEFNFHLVGDLVIELTRLGVTEIGASVALLFVQLGVLVLVGPQVGSWNPVNAQKPQAHLSARIKRPASNRRPE